MFHGEESFKTADFSGSVVREIIAHNGGLLIYGELTENNPCKYFCLEFHFGKGIIDGIENIKTIENISVVKNDNGHNVVLNNFSFSCYDLFFSLKKYEGFSYRNMYDTDEYRGYIQKIMYAEDEKYFREEEITELSDGYSLVSRYYSYIVEHEKGYLIDKVSLSRYTLKKCGKTVYEYYGFSGHIRIFKELVHHRNGHMYYLFKTDLYGLSCLDVDTLEVYNYIPEGYEHDRLYPCGESFIITDVHYDRESNLIACGGCYWAYNYDVMVGDFSNPLNFNPHLVSINRIFDPENDIFYETDFSEWKDNRIYVICEEDSDNKHEKSVSVNELKDMINKLTKGEE